MKLAIILFLTALCQAEDVSRNEQDIDNQKTAKRALEEGNAGIVKRAPVLLPSTLSTATPGIEYAESDDGQSKSPAQETYSTPLPQIAKISDVLTSQGPSYQAAIARHLYSPVSIYQTKIPSPTTYEISAPVPSHLAYSAKMSYQQPIQYTPQLPLTKVQNPKQTTFRFFPNPIQPVMHQAPSAPPVYPQPQIYHVQPQYQYTATLQQPVTYFEPELNRYLQIIPGIIYSQQSENQQAPTLREFKNSPPPNIVQKSVSYASFSQGASEPANNPAQQTPVPPPQQTQNQLPQPLNQLRHIQYQPTPPQYQQPYISDQQHLIYDLPQSRLEAYQTVFPPVPSIEVPQPQNQQQPQYLQMPYQNTLSQYQNQQHQYQQPLNQIGQNNQPPQPQVNKYQAAPENRLVQARDIERPVFFKPGTQQTAVYPPVQYFGKFAQSIFGNGRNH
ncbi:extensin-like isoform X2 [Hyposmocoma kahamanoa]|uniref:extensin-like isoform X2 n=1 Tax=Hyposmocoma kahamanoa TaxID=1477025 RepID=UPI000E6D5DA7|nr:extensin-like isoform X2 [Hyposmocoma kahamanoa]